MILTLYDRQHIKLRPLHQIKDLHIDSVLSTGDKTLSFLMPGSQLRDVYTEAYISTPNDDFVIKSITPSSNGWYQIQCSLNVEELESYMDSFESVEKTMKECLDYAFLGTGWHVGICEIKKKRTIRRTNTTPWKIMQDARKTYRAEIKINSKDKVIDVYEHIGSDKGVYFAEQLNLKQLNKQVTSYDFYTQIKPIGANGLTIEGVNDGNPILSNHTYSKKDKLYIWIDQRYTVAENLKADAQAKLDEMSTPLNAYSLQIIDLAKISDDYVDILNFELGDTVTLMHESTNTYEKTRIVSLVEYPDEPNKNKCEVANSILKFEDIQQEMRDASDTINNVTTDNGTLDGSKVDSITTSQISDFDVQVQKVVDFTAIKAEIDDLRVKSATIQDLAAALARIGTLEATSVTTITLNAEIAKLNQAIIGKADITDLTSITGKITVLESSVATLDTIVNRVTTSDSIHSLVINASTAVIDNAFLKSIVSSNITVNDLLAGDISTTRFKVKSDSGNLLITDNTIQISDANRVRVQVGKDASGDYNMYVWDKSGNLMFDATGITAKGIQRPIIVNDMVSDNANISGDKINITSVIQKINANTTLIESSHILYDGKSLDVAFGTMETSVSTVTSNVNTVTKTVTDNKTKWDTASTNATNALNTANTVTKTVSDNKANWDKAPTALTNANNAQNTANNAQSVANSKAKVFSTQPVPPYQIGDLWVQGTSGVIMRCKTARATGSYTASDWEKADKYTDDTKANAVDTKVTTVTETVKSHSTQLTAQDGKISTLISDTTQVKKDITAVQGDVTTAKGNITTLQTNYSALDQSVKGLSSTVGEHTSKLTTVTNTVNNNKANWDKAPTALDNANKAQSTANTANSKIDGLELGGINLLIVKNVTKYKYLNNSGAEVTENGWFYSDYIPVKGFKNLVASGYSNLGISPSVCYYDKDKKFVKGINNNSQSLGRLMTIDSGIEYIRFSGMIVDLPTLKIEKGTKPTNYSPAPQDVDSSINTVNSRITTEIKTVSDKYATLQQDVNGFKTTVSSTYSTKTEVSKVKSDAATDATNKANQAKTDAINSANANTTSLLKSYSKTEAMNSAITQKADEITAAVSKTYATQATVNTINGDVSALKTWKTSAETKITDTAIVNTVRNSTNYKNDLTGKVGKTEIISCINQTAETIKIDASKIELTGKVTISMLDSDTQTKVNNGNNAMSSINTNKANWDKGKTAYDWTNTNGGNMTNLRNMVLKWTNNAVSTSTYIQGGWIATNTITTAQIATGTIVIGDLDSGVQTKLNTGYDNAYKAYWMSMALSQGQSMYNDPAFLRGINGLDIYNNSNNTAVTITREAKASGWTYDTPYRIKVTSNGTTSPNHGGIRWGFTPKAGHTYLFKLIAKIPTGRTISWHTNDIGTGSKQEWLTPTAGTNDWTEYVCKVKIGTGTISTTGFFSINGGATGFSWYIVYANVFDLGSENLISTFTKGTTEIYGDYIKTGTITANHIRGNKLEGTEIVGGKISSNTTIDVTTDLKVGNNIYLNTPSSGNKYIYFNGTSQFISYNANAINVTSSSSYIRSTGGAYCSARSDGVVISNAKSSMIWMKADNTICVDGPIYTRNGIKFDSSSSTGIYTSWVDLKNHDLLVRSEDMCSCYYGCASISYDQWTYVRGKYVKLYNHSGGYCQVNGAAITSDINLKYDFRTFDERYNDFFMNLRPTIYKYQTGTAKRDHFGYVAQEVESALYKSGLSTNDFAGVIIDKNITRTEDDTDSNLLLDKGINEMHLLRYEEFIALNTHMIQKTIKAVDTQGAMLNTMLSKMSKIDTLASEFDVKLYQMKNEHKIEMQNMKNEYDAKLNVLQNRIKQLESQM